MFGWLPIAKRIIKILCQDQKAQWYSGGMLSMDWGHRFWQGKFSYDKFVTAAREGADCFIEWMRKFNLDGIVTAFLPSGLLFTAGRLSFYCKAVWGRQFHSNDYSSLSLLTPLILVASYMDDLRKIGTIFWPSHWYFGKAWFEKASELRSNFQKEGIWSRRMSALAIQMKRKYLNDISLDIKAGSITSFSWPSGSGKSTIAKLLAFLGCQFWSDYLWWLGYSPAC